MNRVLLTVDPQSASWIYVAGVARALARRDHAVLVVSFGREPSPTRRAEMELDGVRLLHVPLDGVFTEPAFVDRAKGALVAAAREWKPTVVQVDRCVFGDLDLDVPKVLSIACDRTVRVSRGRGPARKGILGADALVSPTRTLAEEIARRFEYRRPIAIIPPGSELGDRPVSVQATRRTRTGLAFYGRTDEKVDGFDLFLEIARKLPADLQVRIGGEGIRPPLPGILSDLGSLGPEGRASLFSRSEIAVLPSRDDPFGVVAAEAALSGCALVLTATSTYRETWSGAAILVKPGDAGALWEAVRALLEDARRREECARHCRARALSIFAASRMVEEHLDVHRRIRRAWAKKAGGPPRLAHDVQPIG